MLITLVVVMLACCLPIFLMRRRRVESDREPNKKSDKRDVKQERRQKEIP